MINTKKKILSRYTKSIKTKNKTKSKPKLHDTFPYYRLAITKKELFHNFNKLKNYKTVFLKSRQKVNKFQGEYIIFNENYEKNKDLNKITDYFSEKCRIQCINNLKAKESPYDFFQRNKESMFQWFTKNGILDVKYNDISEYLYQNIPQCTNFNLTVMVSILKLLKPSRVLDPSAGWGDRLIGAIAYNKCEYTGVDPSNCMEPIYKEIINTLVPRNDRSRYNVIKNGFENVNPSQSYYDLVFTSPPFFDFELYEKSETQSVEKFNTLDKWLNGFLFPLIQKSYNSLIIGGYLGLYISDYTNVYFTKDMFNYIKEQIIGFEYCGDINFYNTSTNIKNNKIKNNKIRVIYFWKKNS